MYYNNESINITKFAQHCVTLDQQIRARTAKQERADKRTGGQGDKRKKTGQEPDDSKNKKLGDNKDKLRFRFKRDCNLIKCFNCDKLRYITKDCRQPKKKDKLAIA